MEIIPKTAVIMCTVHSGLVSNQDALTMGINRFAYTPVKGIELVKLYGKFWREPGGLQRPALSLNHDPFVSAQRPISFTILSGSGALLSIIFLNNS